MYVCCLCVLFTRLRTIQVGFTQISHDGPIRERALSSRRIVPATSDATPANMLSRLPVMEPIDWQAEPPSTSTCDAAEPEQKRSKRSEDQRALEVFQEVCRCVPRHSRTCHRAELLQCRSQIREKLDSNKQRRSKWTTDAELAVLTKLWGCMARRVDRYFDFTYRSFQKGKPADVYFSAKAVKRKLAEGCPQVCRYDGVWSASFLTFFANLRGSPQLRGIQDPRGH